MRKTPIPEPPPPKPAELSLVVLGPEGRLYIEGPLCLLTELLRAMESKSLKGGEPCPQ